MTISKMNSVVDTMAKSNIGYNQWARWTFLKGSTIVPNKDGDCSSICGAIIKLGGYNVDLSGTFYTGNMIQKVRGLGFTVLKYTGLNQVRAGDFVLNVKYHVEYAYTAKRWYSARIDEKGGITGGKPGNQTGKETGFVNAYTYSRGWDYILRPPASSTPKPPSTSGGKAETLNFQKRANTYLLAGLFPDGDLGPVTKNWIEWSSDLQRSLNAFRSSKKKLIVDGDPGPVTSAYVLDVQKRNGLHPDSYPGPVMVKWMQGHGSPIKNRPKNRP